MSATLPGGSFDTDTHRHCTAPRPGEPGLSVQCRCVPGNSDVRLDQNLLRSHEPT